MACLSLVSRHLALSLVSEEALSASSTILQCSYFAVMMSHQQHSIPSASIDSVQTVANGGRQHHRGLPPNTPRQSSGRLRARLGPAHVPDRSEESEYDQATGASGAEPGKTEPRRCR